MQKTSKSLDLVREAISSRRGIDTKFSLSYFSRKIGASEAYLKLVLAGRRNLNLDKAYKLSVALRFTPSLRTRFLLSLLRDEAESDGLKRFFSQIVARLESGKLKYDSFDKSPKIFSDALLWEVYTLVSVEGFKPEAAWIAKRLKNRKASPAAVHNALNALLRAGAIQVDPSGACTVSNVLVEDRNELTNAYIVALERALEHLRSRSSFDDGSFDAFCVVASEDEEAQIRALLAECKSKIASVLGCTSEKFKTADAANAKRHISFLNMNFFQVSK